MISNVVAAPVGAAAGGQLGQQHQGHRADDHLPGGQHQQVHRLAAAQALQQHGADRPAHRRTNPQHLAEQAGMHVPGLDDQQQSAQGGGGRQPLLATHPLAQQRPGQQQGPDRHGEDQHRRLAGPPFHQRPGLQGHEAGDLHQAQHGGLPRGHQSHGLAHQLHRHHQGHGAAHAALGGQGKGRGIHEALLEQHPGVTPGTRQDDQRQRWQIAGEGGGKGGHARRRLDAGRTDRINGSGRWRAGKFIALPDTFMRPGTRR
jgi:hypothetical protein